MLNLENIKYSPFKIIKKNVILTIVADYISDVFALNLEPDYEIVKLFEKQRPLILDVGANRGESIKFFLKYKPLSKIIAFEPNTIPFKKAKKKFKNYKNVKIINRIVSLKNTKIYTPVILNYKIYSLSSTSLEDLKKRITKFFSIPMSKFRFEKKRCKKINIDSLKLNPDIIKIDTEGSEFDVVKCAKKTIKKNKPILIIEYNDSYYKIKNKLKKLNYSPRLFISGKFIKISREKELQIEKMKNAINIVFLNSKNSLF